MVGDRSFSDLLALEHNSGDTEVTLISVLAEQMGSESAGRSARDALMHFDPDLVIVIGIAGGLSNDVRLGDVVISNQIIDVLQNAKVSNGKSNINIELAPNFYDINAELISAFKFFYLQPSSKASYQDWRLECGCDLEKSGAPGSEAELPSLRIGPMACGPVSASDTFNKKLKSIHRKVLAIETESGGVFASLSAKKVPAIAIRGISDLADKEKAALETVTGGSVRTCAMANAAKLLKLVIAETRLKQVALRYKFSEKQSEFEFIVDYRPDLSVINTLEDQIKARLSELSFEFRNQKDGFYLPTPRVRKLIYDEELGGSELEDPENLIETLATNDRVFVHLPRTFPTQALGWSLAYSLIKQPVGGAIILPIHVDVEQIRPPSGKLIDAIPASIRAQALGPEFTQVFIIESPNFGSRSRMRHLISEIGKAGGKVLVLSRTEGHLPNVESFVKSGDFIEYEMAPVSFTETAFFLEKTFGMSPQEAEVVAIRLDDTFRKFRLDAHPTYFAGLQEETLAALIEANKRAELIQLAVDGLLSLIVAADQSHLKLSRSTRERFLRKLVLVISDEVSVNEARLLSVARDFLEEFKFDISAFDFVQPFIRSGLIYFSGNFVCFSHPYLESYLLAQALRDDVSAARSYFDTSKMFNYYAFDIYCELGPDSGVIEHVLKYVQDSMSFSESLASSSHVFVEGGRKLTALSNKGQLQSYRRGLVDQSRRMQEGESDIREKKQRMLDARRHVRSEVNERQQVARTEMPEEVRLEFEALDGLSRALLLSATIVGSGSEAIVGDLKVQIATEVVRVAARFSDLWTRNRARVDFSEIRRELLDDTNIWKFFEDHDVDSALFESFKRDIELSLYGVELSNLMEPMNRVLWRICSLAGVRVLQPVIEEIKPNEVVEKVIAATWLHDVDPSKGKIALKNAMADYTGSPLLRLLLASHLLWRVFWHHYKTPGAPHFLTSVDRVLSPLGLKPSEERLKQVTQGAAKIDG